MYSAMHRWCLTLVISMWGVDGSHAWASDIITGTLISSITVFHCPWSSVPVPVPGTRSPVFWYSVPGPRSLQLSLGHRSWVPCLDLPCKYITYCFAETCLSQSWMAYHNEVSRMDQEHIIMLNWCPHYLVSCWRHVGSQWEQAQENHYRGHHEVVPVTAHWVIGILSTTFTPEAVEQLLCSISCRQRSEGK